MVWGRLALGRQVTGMTESTEPLSSDAGDLDQDDDALMRRIQNRDAAAFEILFHRYSRLVYLIGCRACQQETDADALVVTVFLEIWERSHKYDPVRGSVRTYLMLLANSRATDRLRSMTRRHEFANDAFESLSEQAKQQMSSQDPSLRLEEADLKVRVRKSIESLPSEISQVLEMSFMDGQSHEQIATSLSLPLGTVKSRIRRGLQKFRTHWMANHREPEE